MVVVLGFAKCVISPTRGMVGTALIAHAAALLVQHGLVRP
jgi:hypothetical protein